MNKDTALSSLFLLGLLALCLPLTALADSSWVWISETRPYDLLPFVIPGTILVETAGICLLPRVKKPLRVFWVICLGNALSFLLGYLVLFEAGHEVGYSIKNTLDDYFYTMNAGTLCLTLAIEGPLEYYLLRRHTERPKVLLAAVLGCNVVTSVAIALIEQHFCLGYWY